MLVALRAPVSFEDVLQPLMQPLLQVPMAASEFKLLISDTKDGLATVLEELGTHGGGRVQLHTAMLR